MFSPYYAWANAKTPANPEHFCAMNVALYEPRGGAWAMTERKRVTRSAAHLQIGPSALRWQQNILTAEIEEISVPVPRRLRGRVTFTPAKVQQRRFALDVGGRHRWQPLAPAGRVEVAFEKPGICWAGQAYFDTNDGDAPLADDFSTWNWSRSAGETPRIFYDVRRRDGTALHLALRASGDGVLDIIAPPVRTLTKTGWRVGREVRADAGSQLMVRKTLEDAPFYARSLIEAQIGGERVHLVHESLDLNRFSAAWVKWLLPFRMPRF